MDIAYRRSFRVFRATTRRGNGTLENGVVMAFITIVILLLGLTLLFSGIENKSISDYIREWIGSTKHE